MTPIKAHPVRSCTIILWGDDGNVERELTKGINCEGSLVHFDKRQIWMVYPLKKHQNDTEYRGNCERKGLCVRLGPNDFKRIFGEDIVERAERGEE